MAAASVAPMAEIPRRVNEATQTLPIFAFPARPDFFLKDPASQAKLP